MRGSFAILAIALLGCATAEADPFSYVQIKGEGQFLLDGELLSQSSLLISLKDNHPVDEKLFVCAVSGLNPIIAVDLLKSMQELEGYEIILGMDEECDSSWPDKILEDPNGLVSVISEGENANR